MKSSMSVSVIAILAIVAIAGFASVRGYAQEPPKKGDYPKPPQTPPELKPQTTPTGSAGAVGYAEADMNYADLALMVDESIARMEVAVEKARTLSTSFGELSALHEGADKSEILMMQRMSGSMGSMAAEMKVSLQQYKKLLDDETATESGKVKTEVQNLKGVMDGITNQIDQGLQTLQSMLAQLGQG
jgi:phage-related protein